VNGLAVDGIHVLFGGLAALSNVSFTAPPGKILGLMGANGAGKTTLFNVISGAIKPTRGKVLFDGVPVTGLRPDQICRRGIGRTYQIVRPFAGMSVLENVLVGTLYGSQPESDIEEGRVRAAALLTELGLGAIIDQPAGQLTLAQRKRLEIARALATDPRVLLLDEVLAGLVPTEVNEALTILRGVHQQRGITMLVIEHNMRVLMSMCDQIVVLHHGEKIAEGTPAEVSAAESVIDAYLGQAQ
jgi:branched-chain amino acid transport system ATP-binding protein